MNHLTNHTGWRAVLRLLVAPVVIVGVLVESFWDELPDDWRTFYI